jgi:hypothetical protein
VLEVSDDKSLPKLTRKDLQVKNTPEKSLRAKIIKLADQTSSLRALAFSPPKDWSDDRRAKYLAWARAVVAGLGGTNAWLESYFNEAAASLERSLGQDSTAVQA